MSLDQLDVPFSVYCPIIIIETQVVLYDRCPFFVGEY